MISDTDRKIAEAIKPELKRLGLEKMQVIAIGIAIKENPTQLEKCMKLLKDANHETDSEQLVGSIIETCYC